MKTNLLFIGLGLVAMATSAFRPSVQSQPPTSPLDNLTIPYEEFTVDASICQVYAYATGSKFLIEPQSFVRKDGTPATGQVTVKYREVHNPIEMLLVGVNMRTKQGGSYKPLESGGMFEILAEQNGEPLQLAPNKRIRIRMAAFTDMPNLQVYRYSDSDEAWELTSLTYANKEPDPEVTEAASPDVWGEGDAWGGDDFGYEEFSSVPDYDKSDPAATAYYTKLYRDLEIDKMGFYNYDIVYHEENAVQILADFDFGAGIDKSKQTILVIYKGINSVITYTEGGYGNWKESFYLLKDTPAAIISFLPGKKMAYYSPEKFRTLDIASLQGQKYTFQLEQMSETIESPEELRKVLGL